MNTLMCLYRAQGLGRARSRRRAIDAPSSSPNCAREPHPHVRTRRQLRGHTQPCRGAPAARSMRGALRISSCSVPSLTLCAVQRAPLLLAARGWAVRRPVRRMVPNPRVGAESPRRAVCASAGAHPGATDAPHSRPLLAVAPMMDWTDVHFRQLCRLMTKRTTLWTEMVVDSTIVYTDGKPLACVASGNGEGFDGMTELDRHLWFPPEQRPLVLQVGGSEPEQLRKAAAIAARYEYDEININCGCPSDRVAGKGRFGVCLMFSPEDVADCVKALEEGQTRPVTVKCRIGVDDNDTYDEMKHFVATVSSRTNCRHFIVHARKAWLQGLNPHLNRTIPPLKHEWVFALMRDFPHIEFSLNGGVGGCHEARDALAYRAPGVDRGLNGVMIGRAAYNYPWHCLADADRAVYGEADNPAPNRRWLLREYAKYGDEMIGRFGTDRKGDKKPDARMILKHTLNVFHAERGAREWRRRLEDLFHKPGLSCTDIVEEAMACMSDEVLDSPPPQNYVELERKGYVPVAGAKPGTDVDVQLPEDGSERAAPPRIGKRLATEEEAARLRRAPTPAPAQQTVGSSS